MTNCKAILCGSLAIILLSALVFSVWYLLQPKTLIDTDSLKVVREGSKTTVSDLIGDEQCNFKTVRVKRSEGVSEPATAISTDTISIDILPHGVLKITDKTVEKVYIIKPSGRG